MEGIVEKRRKNIMQFILIGVYIILTISGLTLMKVGGNSGALAIENGNMNFNISLISFAGLFCYLCSFLLFTRLVVMFDLSYIMPLTTGIVQVITLVVSKVVFKENLTCQAILGASLLIIGVLIMNWKRD